MTVAATTIDLQVTVQPLVTDIALPPLAPIDVRSQPLDFSAEPPATIALKTQSARPRVFSFTFAESSPTLPLAPSPPRPAARKDNPERKPTRIKPPGDIIKLEDRL